MPDQQARLTQLFDRLDKIERDSERIHSSLQKDRLWDFMLKLSIPVVLAVGTMVIKHEMDLSTIQASRFSARDAHELEMRLSNPAIPSWLREQLRDIKDLLQVQDARLREVEKKIR